MRNIVILSALAALLAGCVTSSRILVTPLGTGPEDAEKTYVYALPQTILKVEVTCQEVRSVPGPYWEYAEKFLGIGEVIRQPSSSWDILDVEISHHTEADPGHLYSLHLLNGTFREEMLDRFRQKGMLLDGTEMVKASIAGPGLVSNRKSDYLRYVDLGVEENFEERTETMYKTLVTDTSFVRVPVDRTIVEQKTIARKAEEAAEFILLIRSSRFEMLSGEYKVFPQGEAMAAAIDRLDRLEDSYLSLFTGKNLRTVYRRSYFLVPEQGAVSSDYRLGMFSGQLGFVPAGLMEGVPLEVRITPEGKTAGIEKLNARVTEEYHYNQLYYRIPDVVDLKVVLGDRLLKQERISLFQAGALVAHPLD
ncbi:MAG TPA: DUF4831 family protein [Bacteroides sp.]|nr:DUF4831 family protein [Bacteroides sp.]